MLHPGRASAAAFSCAPVRSKETRLKILSRRDMLFLDHSEERTPEEAVRLSERRPAAAAGAMSRLRSAIIKSFHDPEQSETAHAGRLKVRRNICRYTEAQFRLLATEDALERTPEGDQRKRRGRGPDDAICSSHRHLVVLAGIVQGDGLTPMI